jgi:hypothetical protein
MHIGLASVVFGGVLVAGAFLTHTPIVHTILLGIGSSLLVAGTILGWVQKQKYALIVSTVVIIAIGTLLIVGLNQSSDGSSAFTSDEAEEPISASPKTQIPERFEIGRAIWSARNGELGLESDILIFDATGGTYEYTASVYEGELELCTHSDQRTLVGANDGPTAVLVRIPCGSIEGDVLTVTFTDGENTISETLVLE